MAGASGGTYLHILFTEVVVWPAFSLTGVDVWRAAIRYKSIGATFVRS